MLTAAGRVVRDQADADEHLSIKQRVALAGGSAIGGTGEALGATLGEELQPLIDALDVTSMSTIVSVASFPDPLPASFHCLQNTGPGILPLRMRL